jgi:SAM-dependent methyltransferase
VFGPLDALERLWHGTDESGIPTPPRSLDNVGGEFAWLPDTFLKYFVDLGGLRPDDNVLDIGCGVGRMARGLVKYLEPEAGYEGFDIVPQSVEWCERNISSRHSNFHFQLANIYNKYYQRHGSVPAREYRFPFPDNTFAFAFATSVFTHLLPEEVERYLAETARVLRPGGRLFATFYLVNDDVEKLASQGRGDTSRFKHRTDDYWLASRDTPEAMIGFPEQWVRDRHAEAGLTVTDVRHGTWPGRPEGLAGQDIVVAQVA